MRSEGLRAEPFDSSHGCSISMILSITTTFRDTGFWFFLDGGGGLFGGDCLGFCLVVVVI